MGNVIVVIGPGQIGQAIARRVGVGKHVLLADVHEENASAAAETLGKAGYEVSVATVDVSSYQLSKRGNALRVAAEAVRWGRRGARVNTISPGIVITPLAKDELSGPRGEGYRRMIESSPMGRAGRPDEVATVGALLMGPDGGFITGSDFLMDGGVTAAYWYRELDEVRS